MKAYHYLPVLILFFLTQYIHAQNADEIDSLEQLLKIQLAPKDRVDVLVNLAKANAPDIDKVERQVTEAIILADSIGYEEGRILARYEMGSAHGMQADYEASMGHFELMKKEAEKIGFKFGLAQAYFGLGRSGYFLGRLEESFTHLHQAAELQSELGNKKEAGNAYKTLNQNYFAIGEFRKALRYCKVALEMFKEVGSPEDLASIYNSMGLIHMEMGDLSTALEFYYKSLAAEGKDTSTGHPSTINNIGIIYSMMNDEEKSLEFHKNALDRTVELNWPAEEIVLNMINVTMSYHNLGHHHQGLEMALRAYDLLDELESSSEKAMIYHGLGASYDELAEYNKAIDHFQQAVAYFKKAGERYNEAEIHYNIANVYMTLGDFETAIVRALITLKISEEIEFPAGVQMATEVLAYANEKLGRYDQAFEYLETYIELKDSLTNQEQIEQITRLHDEFKFQQERDSVAYAQREAQLSFDRELERKQIALVSSIAGGLSILLILGLLYRSYRIKLQNNLELTKKNEIIGLKNDELTTKNAEINELRETEKQLADEALAMKERELTTVTMLSHEKNTLLQNLGDHIGSLSKKVDERVIPDIEEIKKIIKSNLNEESWSVFMLQFEKVHPKFFSTLKEKYPSLTQYDLRLCSYLKVGMDNKEIAQISAVSVDSAKKSVYRLKKKMELDPEQDLREFLIHL